MSWSSELEHVHPIPRREIQKVESEIEADLDGAPPAQAPGKRVSWSNELEHVFILPPHGNNEESGIAHADVGRKRMNGRTRSGAVVSLEEALSSSI